MCLCVLFSKYCLCAHLYCLALFHVPVFVYCLANIALHASVCCLANIASCACGCHLANIWCACIYALFSKHCFMCLCLHCFSLIFSLVALYYINRLSSAKYAPMVSTVPVGPSKKKKWNSMWMCVSKRLFLLENMFSVHPCKRQGMKELWSWLLLSTSFSTIKVYVRPALGSAVMLHTEERGWERLKTRVFVFNS